MDRRRQWSAVCAVLLLSALLAVASSQSPPKARAAKPAAPRPPARPARRPSIKPPAPKPPVHKPPSPATRQTPRPSAPPAPMPPSRPAASPASKPPPAAPAPTQKPSPAPAPKPSPPTPSPPPPAQKPAPPTPPPASAHNSSPTSSSLGLSPSFYALSCPGVELAVSNAVRSASTLDPTIPGKLLRMVFHDCFVEVWKDSRLTIAPLAIGKCVTLVFICNHTLELLILQTVSPTCVCARDALCLFHFLHVLDLGFSHISLRENCPGVMSLIHSAFTRHLIHDYDDCSHIIID
jgi:hypothetical protein